MASIWSHHQSISLDIFMRESWLKVNKAYHPGYLLAKTKYQNSAQRTKKENGGTRIVYNDAEGRITSNTNTLAQVMGSGYHQYFS